VDERLIPINGLLALLRGEGGWPRLLGDQGFRRHLLEVPLSTRLGDLRADAVIYRCDPNLILLCEAKSGRNLDEEQAHKYVAADLTALRRVGVVPHQLRGAQDVAVHPLFVGRQEHQADLEASLRRLRIAAPLLTVGSKRVRLCAGREPNGLMDFDCPHGGALPPARVPVDQDSSDQDLLELLVPEIVAVLARNVEYVQVERIAEHVIPEWPILAHGQARSRLIHRIVELIKGPISRELRGQVRYEPLRQPDTRGRIVVESTPATRDPRGRTQSWQALERRAARVLKRSPAAQIPGQLSLDDLADEGGLYER
jgi:hypothetical protein